MSKQEYLERKKKLKDLEQQKPRRLTCFTCFRPKPLCLCCEIAPLPTKTHFVLLMHPKEAKKQKLGTGRMTLASLPNSQLIVAENPDNDEKFVSLLENSHNQCFLLYPGADALNLSQSETTSYFDYQNRNVIFFILDATWPCAKKMMRLSSCLKTMDKVTFPPEHQSQFLIKHQPDLACLSTIESVYHTLNSLQQIKVEECETTDFLKPFQAMIRYQITCATDPSIPSNRGHKRKETIVKQRIRPKTHRLFFWDTKKSPIGRKEPL